MENRGYRSVEEHMRDYTELFMRLQETAAEEAGALFREESRRIGEREQASEIFLPAVFVRECCGLVSAGYWLVMLAFCCEAEEGLCLDFQRKYHERQPNLQYGLHLLSAALPVDYALLAELCGQKGALADFFKPYPEYGEGKEAGCLARPLLLARAPFVFLLTGALQNEEWYEIFLSGEQEKQKLLPLHIREGELLSRYMDGNGGLRILLHGGRGSGKHTLVRQVCARKHRNAVFVKLSRMRRETEPADRARRQTLRFLCRLLEPLTVLELPERTAENDTAEWEDRLRILLSEELSGRNVVLLTEGALGARLAGGFSQVRLSLAEMLSSRERALAMDAWFSARERGEWQEELLGKYHMNIGELAEDCRAVRIQAEAESSPVSSRALWERVLAQRSPAEGFGRLIEYRAAMEDIVLPETCKKQLETVLRLAKVWKGRQGLHLLFHGSSGTGKTMAASVLAGELQLPLYKVDLSRIFDKYIGETEKHIEEVFRTAERGRYLLFFDEADALFAKRTDIQSSHDRYANVSASYLLQRIEEYSGVLILATNLMNHFDDAFVRRIRFAVKFQNLDTKGRELLWEKELAGEALPAEDVSFAQLAQAAQLSPARICSAVQVAKLLAAGGPVTRELLREALELEAAKDETIVKKF